MGGTEPQGDTRAGQEVSVWALLGARAGDNAQVLQLARMLEQPFAVKALSFNAQHKLPNFILGAGLASLDGTSRGAIAPPWPALVIAAGKRTAPVALHIKRASGNLAVLVHIGRPRAALKDFDLVVTTPQYGLPAADNVVELALPLAVPQEVEGRYLARWRELLAALPRPWIGVAVGAGKFPQRFGVGEAHRLSAALSALAGKLGGSLIVMGSPRSSEVVFAAVTAGLGQPFRAYPWQRGVVGPYQAALALCDRFVVTADSVSMISEAMATGRPTHVFDLPVSPLFVSWSAREGFAAQLAARGWIQAPRNVPAFAAKLLARGYALAMDDTTSAPRLLTIDHDGLVTRIRTLVQNTRARRSAS